MRIKNINMASLHVAPYKDGLKTTKWQIWHWWTQHQCSDTDLCTCCRPTYPRASLNLPGSQPTYGMHVAWIIFIKHIIIDCLYNIRNSGFPTWAINHCYRWQWLKSKKENPGTFQYNENPRAGINNATMRWKPTTSGFRVLHQHRARIVSPNSEVSNLMLIGFCLRSKSW